MQKKKIHPPPLLPRQKWWGVHFIGIGGIGVSALAQYFLRKGWEVSGSDLVSSEIIILLKKLGAKIFIGKHKAGNLSENAEKVIYSPAVKANNPELKKAKKLQSTCPPKPAASGAGRRENYKLQTLSYPEALGDLTKEYYTIAVSGTHGKSTTAAMISLILTKAGLDPTVIVGTKLKEWGNSNFRMGKTKYLVIEADEWQASFLNYWPKMIVLTNIEKEHLDYYRDLKHILKIYKEYVGHLPKNGVLVLNEDDENIRKILNPKHEIRWTRSGLSVGLHPKQSNPTESLTLRAIQQNPKFKIQNFSLKQKETKELRKILKIPGEHNVADALAALTVARVLGIDDKISFQALAEYKGSWRRFDVSEIRLENKPLTLINDYAHHPTEIKATLKAIREKYTDKKIWCVFQPHQYQRTFYLFDDFVRVFRQIRDKFSINLIITDIYDVAGRENKKIKEKVNSEKMVKRVGCLYLGKDKIISYLKKNLKGNEIVILMGAGDIYDLNSKLSTTLLDKRDKKKENEIRSINT